jgi:hypothetical protein
MAKNKGGREIRKPKQAKAAAVPVTPLQTLRAAPKATTRAPR